MRDFDGNKFERAWYFAYHNGWSIGHICKWLLFVSLEMLAVQLSLYSHAYHSDVLHLPHSIVKTSCRMTNFIAPSQNRVRERE